MSLLFILPLLAAGMDILTDDPRPAGVSISGALLVGPKGTPLYTVDDMQCTDACLNAWPVLEAEPTAKPIGDWIPYQGQWIFKRKPVHYFSSDHDALEATGNGVGKWHAIVHLGRLPQIPLPANAKVSKAGSSFVLTDYRGHTLYTFDRDGKSPACDAECLEVWPPLLAPALAEPVGDWRPVDRPDGVRQWAYRRHLIYTFSEDMTPSDMNGANAGGVWKVINVEDPKNLAAKTS